MDHHITPNESKFAELLLYVAKRSTNDPTFGAVKLNKILFYAEFGAYRDLGRPITGIPFQNLEHGPGPRRLLPIQSELLDNGDAKITYEPTPSGVQKRLVPLREPDVSLFDQDELDLIDGEIRRLRGKSAMDVSDESHEEVGWLVTTEGETIPYYMALLSAPEPTEADRQYVKELEKRGALQRHL